MYDHTTVQLYKMLLLAWVVNCTAGTPMPRLCPVVQWSVHWALSQTTRVLVLAGARHWNVQEKKKMQAPLLGLAKSIYYHITRKWPFELSKAIVYQKVHHIIDGSLEHTCQRHILALNTWYQYPYSPYSSFYIFFSTDKENSINNQSNLDWWSLPFILMT